MNCKRRNISGGNPKQNAKGVLQRFSTEIGEEILSVIMLPKLLPKPSIIDSTSDAFIPAPPYAPHLPGSAYRKRKNGAPPTTDNQHGTAPRRRRLGILMNFSRDFLRLRYYPHLASGGGAGVVPSVGG